MSGEVSAGLGPANEVVAVAKKKAGIGVGQRGSAAGNFQRVGWLPATTFLFLGIG